MRIYTKTGDKGMTRIIGGSKVSKDNIRIDAYGTLDELNSLIGYTITTLGAEPEIQAELEQIQQQLFDAGGDLATEEGKRAYKLTSEPVAWLEDRIASMPMNHQKSKNLSCQVERKQPRYCTWLEP